MSELRVINGYWTPFGIVLEISEVGTCAWSYVVTFDTALGALEFLGAL